MKSSICALRRFFPCLPLFLFALRSSAQTDAAPTSSDEPVVLRQRIAVLERDLQALREEVRARPATAGSTPSTGHLLGENLLVSGEGAVGYFDSQRNGRFPNRELRVDEARSNLEARLADSAFLFSEFNLAIREDDSASPKIGELYVDLEDLANLWGGKAPLTLRLGRFQIPFGEEYRHRNADRNPLISHSLGDVWGVDEGVEIFGNAGKLDYVLAVQNGGYQTLRDGNADKSVALRLGGQVTPSLRASLSLLRTGDLSAENDKLGELWFGNSYLFALGDPKTTRTFHAELAEADLRLTLPSGHLAAAAGILRHDDDQPDADNQRTIPYGYLEGVHDLTNQWYAGTRLSALWPEDGYPVNGQGGAMTMVNADQVWRWSLGGGYRWSKQLTLKAEYSLERGNPLPAEPEAYADPASPGNFHDRDLISAEAAYAF